MAYVAVKGGEKAIAAAHALLAEARRGDPDVPELAVAQIREQLGLAVDRVMAESSCYDPDLAALALKQACGDAGEAIFLLRAYRTTLPRFGATRPIATGDMIVRRRVSAAYKDLPGGQVLGPTFDYTHRLFDFTLAGSPGSASPEATVADVPSASPMPTILEVMGREDLLEPQTPAVDDPAPFDLTRDPPRYPAGRDQRLQALARGDEGFLLGVAYSSLRGWGGDHPLCGEVRLGEVALELEPPELGFAIEIGEITVTECQMIGGMNLNGEAPPRFAMGYGLTFGHGERKAMSMAIVDRALSSRAQSVSVGDQAPAGPAEDDEFVLSHADNVESSGFVQHLKLPHYVDFQAELQLIRRLRREWYAAEEAKGVTPIAEAAE